MALPQPKYLPLDEIRDISIIDIYNRYIGGYLRQRGRQFWARCQWHGNDSSPSLKLYPDQNTWWCYGCQQGGSAIDLVMRALNLDFKSAARQIAIDYGLSIHLPDREVKKKLAALRTERELTETLQAEIDRMIPRLCKLNRSLIELSKDVRICLRYPSIFMHQLEIDQIVFEMLGDDQAAKVAAWRRAKKVYPWII